MQSSSSVPTWVPIVVAILGILGIIAGQVVNSWKEERRWKRELAREDVRWQREQERHSEQHRHDKQQKNRELQMQIYADLVATMTKIETNLVANISVPDGHRHEVELLHSENQQLNNESAQLLAKIQMISTEEIADAATSFQESLIARSHQIFHKSRDESGLEEAERLIDEIFRPYNHAQKQFFDAVKAEFLD
ncbi:hypothetical protein AB0M80_08260 [Amycolatopsis sp. NPDC051045]|uniref:hypothetical protein n=1 Tax=Amycolatopsis sp. NPDC051045 TaxID=3156922 RepID=UPI00343A148D